MTGARSPASPDDPQPPGGTAPGDGRAARSRNRAVRWRDRLTALAWMVGVWNLLWGRLSWGNLLGGLLVGLAVLVFFPLPPVTFGGRLRPRALLVLAGRFVTELVSASIHVARVAVQPGYLPRGAIIAVRLRVRTDLNLALTAEAISLVPGTLIIDVDRERGLLYVHVLDVRGPADLPENRDRVLATEARIVRAIGSATELRLLDTPAPDVPAPAAADPDPPTDRGQDQ
ncbi:Na+/H+ antiporter subunit E [Micromonospora rubida]|uniref:Na+/H+ antiporter subunit E n=1 Tax=Micromonospora rubida TaxID=2697657 RepID=UPI001378F872|nr:Na+/H+ antiporter subunit E [Micromonospora rubida]NBE82031.1 Na+/H+ antiporter subunit E [Micromonospora rubida]